MSLRCIYPAARAKLCQLTPSNRNAQNEATAPQKTTRRHNSCLPCETKPPVKTTVARKHVLVSGYLVRVGAKRTRLDSRCSVREGDRSGCGRRREFDPERRPLARFAGGG